MSNELAPPTVHQLPNGLCVVCQENHSSPVVALHFWVGVGSADEDEAAGEAGLAHVHEHMLFKGTARRGVGEIARAVESTGGEINAWTSFDNTVYYVVTASRFFDTALDVLVDAVRCSTFDPEELSRELEVVLEEIKRSQDIPARMLSNWVFDTAYRVHPYRRPVIGTEASVRAFTRDKLLAFYQRHYRPERMVLVLAGDFETGAVMRLVEQQLGSYARGEGPPPPRPAEPTQDGTRVVLRGGDTQETYLTLVWHIPEITHPDVPALDVLSVLLGHGESSQLSRSVRYQQRLVNEVYAYTYTPRDRGLMFAGATLHHDNLLKVGAALVQETERLRAGRVAVREIDKAKTIIESEAVYQRETAQGLARKLGFFQAILGDLGEEQRYYEAVRQVTPDDVQRVARRYLGADNLSCVAMLPQEQAQTWTVEALRDAVCHPPAPRRSVPRQPAGKTGAVRTVLDSGTRVIVLPDHTVPVVAFRVAWLGGQRVEVPARAGIGNLAARLLTKGTASRSALEIAHAVDAMAASLDGFSGRNTIGLHGDFLTRFAERGFDLLRDCARRPVFGTDDLDRERHNVLEQIRAREDDLPSVCFQLFSEGLYPTHPYRLDMLGDAGSVSDLTRDDLQALHARFCTPGQAVVAIGGDIEIEQALELAQAGFGGAPGPDVAPPPAPAADPPPLERRVLRRVSDRAQAHLAVGFMGPTFTGGDRFGYEVLATLLSGQSGRLFLELRDRRSLAYSVTAINAEGVEPGYFVIYIGTSPQKVDAAIAGIEEQLRRLRDEPPDADELERAKRYLIGAHEIGLQRVGARASLMAFNEIYGVGYESHLDYAARIEAVSRDDLVRLVEARLDPAHAVVAIVGPEGCGGPQATAHH